MPRPQPNRNQKPNNNHKNAPKAATKPAQAEPEAEEEKEETLSTAGVDSDLEDEGADDDDEDDDDDSEEDDAEETSNTAGAPATTSSETKPKRLRGKRQIIFVCGAKVDSIPEDIPARNLKKGDSALIMARIPVTTPPQGTEFNIENGRKEAKEIFFSKYETVALDIDGPFFLRKGLGQSGVRKRETLSSTLRRKLHFIAKRGTAIHRVKEIDWNVIVSFTSDPNVVEVFYDKAVDEQAYKALPKEKKPQKPGRKYLPITSMQNLVVTDDNTGSAAQA